MYLDIAKDGLPRRSLLNELVAPRPIGWISTHNCDGRDNLAPFSHFNVVSTSPAFVLFSCNTPVDRSEKDTIANVRRSGEFVANLVTLAQAIPMVATSEPAPYGTDEFELVGLGKVASTLVTPPRVAGAPAALECKVHQIIQIKGEGPRESDSTMVLGRVIAVHIDDEFLDADGRFNTAAAQLVARLGGHNYLATGESFQITPKFTARD